MNKMTKSENNIYRQEKIIGISVKYYLVIRISNLKKFDAFVDIYLN